MSLSPHRHYASEDEALHSKSCTQHGWVPEQCAHGLYRLVPPKAPPAPLMRRKAGKAKGRRDTGPDAKTRALVLARDSYACVCCGRSVTGQPYSLQHRKRRSQGGDNSPANLVTVLGTGTTGCHERIDSRRDPEDEAKGYTVRSWDDPALVPVMLFSSSGSGVTVWLTGEGTYSTEPPGGVSAA